MHLLLSSFKNFLFIILVLEIKNLYYFSDSFLLWYGKSYESKKKQKQKKTGSLSKVVPSFMTLSRSLCLAIISSMLIAFNENNAFESEN
jgi:hypothetical protein